MDTVIGAILFTLFLWWFSTGVILYLDGLPRRTFRWSLLGATVLFAVALYGLAVTRSDTSVTGAYLAFTFGVLVWGFQEGHLRGALGFDHAGSLALWLPFLVFFLAFGLSMDYEVFLLSRIKEEWDRTHDNDRAVALGLQRSGRIITSAALLIAVVFAAFATGDAIDIKALGVGLTLAIVLDATVVRTLLVPATMKLLGAWNWWAPGPLRAIYERFGLHEPPDDHDREIAGDLVDRVRVGV